MKQILHLIGISTLVLASTGLCAQADILSEQNVSWNTPGGEMASMPVGNGDIAGNVWVETNGDVMFYIAKSDAWNEYDRLLKVGRIRVSFHPALDTTSFKQTLDLQRGEVVIAAGTGAGVATVRVWADANHPVMRVACESATPRACTARVELWRNENEPYRNRKEHSNNTLDQCGQPVINLADTVMEPVANRIGWFHRNTESTYGVTLKTQHLGPLVEQFPDPLLNRTFGALGFGSGMTAAGPLELKSAAPATGRTLEFVVLTAQTPSVEAWRKKARALADDVAALDAAKARAAHEAWWNSFWNRSFVFISGTPQAETVTRGYTLQRYMVAASSRGAAPPKFNGGLFTVQMPGTLDPDYRRWGGNYWFQNNRWLNWPSLAAGDYDLMLPFFQMYRVALPLAEARTKLIFGHEGAFFPETMHFWGTHNGNDFHVYRNGGKWQGWNNPDVLPCNPYIKYYWQGGIELAAMMLDYYDHTRDQAFARDTLLPLASSIATFFDRHWKRDANGKIRFDPTQSLETWQVAINDAPTIAGLMDILPRLLEIPGATDAQKAAWRKTLADLPPLPRIRLPDGKEALAPAETYDEKRNRENSELYAVFPYRLYGVGKPELQLARDTFTIRASRELGCWTQNGVHAAMLGLADEARDNAIYNFSADCAPQRFPGFWPPGADWTPDLDNGGTGMMTVQRMLLQQAGDKILLFPAWSKEWDVNFKLHAAKQTIIECEFRDGKVTKLIVTPESRRKDVEVCAPFSAEQADVSRGEMDLSRIPWKLWLDQKAAWTNDELFLPPVDLSKVPEHPPTGGWAALDRVKALSVKIPGTVEEYLGKGNGATGDVKGVSWWFCDVTVPKVTGAKRLLLRFDSARLRAEVYVNRKLAAYDIIGNTPFEADISKFVNPGEPCRIAVRITDPNGGFDWRDSSPDVWGKYKFPASHGFGGVTGKVRLLLVDQVYVSDIYVQNRPSLYDVGVQVTVRNTEARPVKARLVADIVEKADSSKVLASVESKEASFACGDTLVELPVSAPQARLWQLDDPNLYRCRVKVVREGATLDQDGRVFGFRWFAPEGIGKDARFKLNGKRIVLRSAISWGFWPCSGMVPTPELAEKEVRTAKALGLNMLNFHRSIGQPIGLDKADELGLLIYEEPGGYASARDDAFAQAIAREKLLRMVKRDRSHPALIVYNMINEAWAMGGMETNQAVQQARQQDIQAAHAVDPSRCITYTSAWSDFKEGVEERARLHMRPYDDTCWFSGWFDRHFATGPECYLESFYGGPTNIYHSFPNRSEIVFLGEEGAISTPDRLALIKRDLAKSQHTGWDGKIYAEWIQAVEQFMSDKHLRQYFPDLDEFTKSLGHISHYYQGRIIEGFRIGNTGDGYVVNGWESEVMENHSGIVDCYRNPKADPSVMAWYNQPLYIAVKLRNKIAKSPDRIIADLYIVNEKDVKGAHALAVTIKNPAGQEVFHTQFPVSPTGGERYGELLKEGLELPVTHGGGLYKVEAVLRNAAGTVVARGRDDIFAVDFAPNRLSGKGAVLDASGVIARVLKTEKNVDVPAYSNQTGRLDWIVVADPPGGAPRAVPPSCFRLPTGDGEGLRTVFYSRSDFKDKVHSRTDKAIDFTCVEGAPPDPALGVMTGYEIRWEGKFVAPTSGDYTFALQHDRNARLWIGGTQVMDDWRADRFVQGATARVRLEAGKPVDFRLDYNHANDCPALVKLMWVPPGTPAIDTGALLRRVKDDGATVIIVDGADQWAPVLKAAGAVNYDGKFNIGKYWAGGQYFVRDHPLFKDLPVNGALDWPYQALIRYDKHRYGLTLTGEEVVVGCYQSTPFQLGTAVGVVPYGKGRIVLSTLQICSNLENLDRASQVARKLLLNYVDYAGEFSLPGQ